MLTAAAATNQKKWKSDPSTSYLTSFECKMNIWIEMERDFQTALLHSHVRLPSSCHLFEVEFQVDEELLTQARISARGVLRAITGHFHIIDQIAASKEKSSHRIEQNRYRFERADGSVVSVLCPPSSQMGIWQKLGSKGGGKQFSHAVSADTRVALTHLG